ncbi:hypothetical protein TNCV_1104771 [Trichonephila clavipes]|nr:hypothetical protein TNCV_1104771 [Trichonephila clavipes]
MRTVLKNILIDLSEPMNSDCDTETDKEDVIKTVECSNALLCLEILKTYPMLQNENDAVSSLHKVEKELFLESGIKKIVKPL